MSKGGRPTKYKPEYAAALIRHFSVPKHTTFLKKETIIDKTGKTEREWEMVAADLPTFEGFARKIGVNGDTVVEWAKATNEDGTLKHPDFSAAYKVAKDLQKEFLIDNGLKGLYPPAAYIFTAKNVTDMRDKQEVENRTEMHLTGFEQLKDEDLDAVITKLKTQVGQGAGGEGEASSGISPEVHPAAPEAAGSQPL